MRAQSGHISTYLVPWIAGAAAVGAIAGALFGRDAAAWALVAGGAVLCGFIALSAIAGWAGDRRAAAAAREAVRAWAAARGSGALALDVASRLLDGYDAEIVPGERSFGGAIAHYPVLGIDAGGAAIALACDATLHEISLRRARSWRRTSDPPAADHRPAGPLFVIELPPSSDRTNPDVVPVNRLEIVASAHAAALEAALRRTLGEPGAAR